MSSDPSFLNGDAIRDGLKELASTKAANACLATGFVLLYGLPSSASKKSKSTQAKDMHCLDTLIGNAAYKNAKAGKAVSSADATQYIDDAFACAKSLANTSLFQISISSITQSISVLGSAALAEGVAPLVEVVSRRVVKNGGTAFASSCFPSFPPGTTTITSAWKASALSSMACVRAAAAAFNRGTSSDSWWDKLLGNLPPSDKKLVEYGVVGLGGLIVIILFVVIIMAIVKKKKNNKEKS